MAGQIYTSAYKYNLSGALVEQTYPSGRKVRNIYNADGDLAAIASRKTPVAGNRTLASDFAYSAAGAISKLKLGNGRWESAQFNSRLQITELALGTSPTDGSLWKVNYAYGELEADGTTVNAAKNNGTIAKQIITVPGHAQPFVQTYRYDSLYRLTEAKERFGNQANSEQTWKQTFGYDRFGNRTNFSQIVGTNQLAINNQTHPTINPVNNRFNDNQGYIYDYNGNLISDAENGSFAFNADNKQVEVKDSSNQTVIGRYFYDGIGMRVRKVTGTEITIFVYDGTGKLIAEYAPPPVNSPNPTTNYTTADYLGSPRVVTNQAGEVTSRRDFMPFGEELTAEDKRAGGTEAAKYSDAADKIRKRFTGYEKDNETGLDFAEARYYQNKHGRFTAIDPLLASGKSANPQTFNRYVYCLNNPSNMIDKDGKQPRWGQLASKYQIAREIRRANKNANVTRETPLHKGMQALLDHFKGDRKFTVDKSGNLVETKDSVDVKRYVYTTEKGWIDMYHFFRLAEWTRLTWGTGASAAGSAGEFIQKVNGDHSSSFSYEDITSNAEGVRFWKEYGERISKGEINIDDAAEQFLTSIGATNNPQKAPNYDIIPHIAWEDVPPLQYEFADGLKGDELKRRFEIWFKSLSKENQDKIRRAHEQIRN